MQSAWDKYMDFSFEIIEIVEDTTLLDTREQHYIDLYFDEPNCMNLAKYVDSPSRGLKASEETKAKLSASSATAKQVQVTAPDGSIEIFKSASAAALRFGTHRHTIQYYCTGENPQPGTGRTIKKTSHLNGYIFNYLENA
jgi:hypothetical protein